MCKHRVNISWLLHNYCVPKKVGVSYYRLGYFGAKCIDSIDTLLIDMTLHTGMRYQNGKSESN